MVTLLQYIQKMHGMNNLKEEEVLRTVKEERLILRKIKKKKGDLIGLINDLPYFEPTRKAYFLKRVCCL